MSKVSMKDIKKLREITNARVMDCKKALEEAKGNLKKAQELVKKKGLARAEKNKDRETKAGFIGHYVHTNGMVGSMVEVLCETDFVAQNKEFKKLAKELAMHITLHAPKDVEELMSQDYIKDPENTVETVVKALSGKIGEKMVVRNFVRYEINS